MILRMPFARCSVEVVTRDVTGVIGRHTRHDLCISLPTDVYLAAVEMGLDLTRHVIDVMMQQGSHASITRDDTLAGTGSQSLVLNAFAKCRMTSQLVLA